LTFAPKYRWKDDVDRLRSIRDEVQGPILVMCGRKAENDAHFLESTLRKWISKIEQVNRIVDH